jgi:hypothetical protein
MVVPREYIPVVQGVWQVQVLTPLYQEKQEQVEVVPDVVMVAVAAAHQISQKGLTAEMVEYPEEVVEEGVVEHPQPQVLVAVEMGVEVK